MQGFQDHIARHLLDDHIAANAGLLEGSKGWELELGPMARWGLTNSRWALQGETLTKSWFLLRMTLLS